MKHYYVTVDYERFALIHKDQIADIDVLFIDETWNPLEVTLFDDDGQTVLGEKTVPGRAHGDWPLEWHQEADTMIIRQEGSADYELDVKDGDVAPTINELKISPMEFRGELLDVLESHGLTSAEIVQS